MTRSMKDFVDSRQDTIAGDVRIDVPVFLPGYAAVGKFGADPSETFPGIIATLYSIPSQMYRVPMRTINKFLKPNQPVYERAKLRNFEVVLTDQDIFYCPTSPLMLKNYDSVYSEPISGTAINFFTDEEKMSQLSIGGNVWHVHPEYAGDVRWALRRIANENPDYAITFGGVDLPDSATAAANKAAAAAAEAARKAEAAAAAAATAAAVAGEPTEISADEESEDDHMLEDDEMTVVENEEE